MLAADFLQKCEVIFRRNDKSAFAQDRLGDNRGHRLRRHNAFERVHKMMRESFRSGALLGAIRISEGYAIYVAGERRKSRLVGMRFAGECHGQQRATMKCILEANHRGALGIDPRDFDRVLHSFRAGIHDDGFLGSLSGCQRV